MQKRKKENFDQTFLSTLYEIIEIEKHFIFFQSKETNLTVSTDLYKYKEAWVSERPAIELKIYFVGKIVEQAEICASPWGRLALPSGSAKVTRRYALTRPKSFIVQLAICSPRKIALPGRVSTLCPRAAACTFLLFFFPIPSVEFHLRPPRFFQLSFAGRIFIREKFVSQISKFLCVRNAQWNSFHGLRQVDTIEQSRSRRGFRFHEKIMGKFLSIVYF